MRDPCWSWPAALALTLTLTLGAAAAAAAPPAALQVLLLDSREIDLPGHGKRNKLELSDLAWDAASGMVWAVSDRGWLHRWQVEIAHGRLEAVQELARIPVDGRPNLEALALRPGIGQAPLLAVDEVQRQWLELDEKGRVVARHALPPSLPTRGKHSVEAMAWHNQHGVLLAAQKSGDAGEHRIISTAGPQWRIAAAPGSQLKAMTWLRDGRLLLLERQKVDGRPRFRLRALAVSACGVDILCATSDMDLSDASVAGGDHYEGMACRGSLCLLVSDDGGADDRRTRLLLIELPGPGR